MRVLGHRFSKLSLLQAALTHRSSTGFNNERLEFLGDAILNLVMADKLYQDFEHASEGELSRMRASLVKGQTLAEIAQDLGLGAFLKLGVGERKSGGFRRESILADALEAIVAAIYLDAGLEACTLCITRWYQSRLETLLPQACHKDPKTRLQEWLQAKQLPLPVYTVLDIKGGAHDPIFSVQCCILSLSLEALGVANSRRRAEQAAAEHLLHQMEAQYGK
jgi:ribonuclease III